MERQSFIACAFEQKYIYALNNIKNFSYRHKETEINSNKTVISRESYKISAVKSIKFPKIQVLNDY